MEFGVYVESKSLIHSTGGLGSRCNVVGEKMEVGGLCEDDVLDGYALCN